MSCSGGRYDFQDKPADYARLAQELSAGQSIRGSSGRACRE
jgi:hypothetical protein